ncbi:hypothetical protein CERSUDRAFT_84788, partial [Gelatoporia subvermispora B]
MSSIGSSLQRRAGKGKTSDARQRVVPAGKMTEALKALTSGFLEREPDNFILNVRRAIKCQGKFLSTQFDIGPV